MAAHDDARHGGARLGRSAAGLLGGASGFLEDARHVPPHPFKLGHALAQRQLDDLLAGLRARAALGATRRVRAVAQHQAHGGKVAILVGDGVRAHHLPVLGDHPVRAIAKDDDAILDARRGRFGRFGRLGSRRRRRCLRRHRGFGRCRGGWRHRGGGARRGCGIADRGGERQGQQPGADKCAPGEAPALGDVGHGHTPQAMKDRAFAQHRAGHRRAQRHRRGAARGPGKAGDERGIGGPLGRRAARHHPGIAGRLLIAPQRQPAIMGKRVEPVQREQRLHQEVDQQIAAAVMGKLVRQREVARLAIGHGKKAAGQRDHPVEHAKGQRSAGRRGLDQPHRAHAFGEPSGEPSTHPADFARLGEQRGAQGEIGGKAAPQEHPRSAEPQREQHVAQRQRVKQRNKIKAYRRARIGHRRAGRGGPQHRLARNG